jgi:hypothetical protein
LTDGEAEGAISTDGKGRPSESDSSQKAKPGDKPSTNISVTLHGENEDTSKMSATEKRLFEANQKLSAQLAAQQATMQDMGTKLQFAVETITNLSDEKKRIKYRAQLSDMIRNGAPIPVNRLDKYVDRMVKMSEAEAGEWISELDAMPKHNIGGRVKLSEAAGTSFESALTRHSAEFTRNPDKFAGSGLDEKSYAASMVLGDLMAGGESQLGQESDE